jgi:hypothetical protein
MTRLYRTHDGPPEWIPGGRVAALREFADSSSPSMAQVEKACQAPARWARIGVATEPYEAVRPSGALKSPIGEHGSRS